MLSKTKLILLIIVLAGLAPSAVSLFNSVQRNYDLPAQASSALLLANIADLYGQGKENSGLPASPVGRPVRLKIPAINVDVAVEYVGLTSDGAMDVPKSPNNVAWFEPGSRPGDSGSAVIAGHYGWKNGRSSVFDDLHELQAGDKLYIEDDKGSKISFVVRESRRYDPEADASSVFGSDDGRPRLNLITCEGSWDETLQTYSERLVVFTDRE